MSLTQSSNAAAKDASKDIGKDGAKTAEQHHLKSAEHLDLASAAHKDAAKCHASGDKAGAASCEKKAESHTATAAQHAQKASGKPSAQASR
jgi:hypothetical protein